MTKLLVLKMLVQRGRLLLRLARDRRTPLHAKAVLGLTLLYVLSPLDFVPDWLPLAGQLDDLAILMAGLSFFVRLCPPEVVAEHEWALGGKGRITMDRANDSRQRS